MGDALKAKARVFKSQADEAEVEVTRFEVECAQQLSILDQQINALVAQRTADASRLDQELAAKAEHAAKKARFYTNFAQSIGLGAPSPRPSPRPVTSFSQQNSFIIPETASSTEITPPVTRETPHHHDAPLANPTFTSSRGTSLATSATTIKLERQPSNSSFDTYSVLNAAVPSQRLNNSSTTKSSNKKPALTLDNYPVIVPSKKNKNEWVELRCYICNGNAREDGLFLKGLKGLKRHMQLSHGDHFQDLPLKQQFNLDAAIVRRFNRQELDSMLAGTIPRVQMIICEKEVATGAEVEDSLNESTVYNPRDHRYDAYDTLISWPTIVLREDMIWIELRCYICGGNSPNTKKFSEGINGMMKHLKKDHAVAIPDPYVDFIVRKCQYRQLAPGEFESLDDGNKLREIEMVPFESTTPSSPLFTRRSDIRSNPNSPSMLCQKALNVKALSLKKRIGQKRSSLIQCDDEFGEQSKRPRRTSNPRDDSANVLEPRQLVAMVDASEDHLDHTFSQQKTAVMEAKGLGNNPNDQASSIMDFCPCTVSGHACQLPTCEKNGICVSSVHTEECQEQFWHDPKPTCQHVLNIGFCADEKICEYGHDSIEYRQAINEHHDCLHH